MLQRCRRSGIEEVQWLPLQKLPASVSKAAWMTEGPGVQIRHGAASSPGSRCAAGPQTL